jgi:hypothetical protein
MDIDETRDARGAQRIPGELAASQIRLSVFFIES